MVQQELELWRRIEDVDFRAYLIENPKLTFNLKTQERGSDQLDDITLNSAYFLVTGHLVMPLIKEGILPWRGVVFDRGWYSDNIALGIENAISDYLQNRGKDVSNLKDAVFGAVVSLAATASIEMNKYLQDMSMFSIVETMLNKEVSKACRFDVDAAMAKGVLFTERELKRQQKDVIKKLQAISTKNCWQIPLISKALNAGQFYQTVSCSGTRTDLAESLFRLSMVGNFLTGGTGIIDFTLESQAGRKAELYSEQKVDVTSYFARQALLATSPMQVIYFEDCGRDDYLKLSVPMSVTDARVHDGAFYIDRQTNTLKEFRAEDPEAPLGKLVEFRNPALCRHLDGTCVKCMGSATASLYPTTAIGLVPSLTLGEIIKQLVLSAKHHSVTSSTQYDLPYHMRDTFIASAGEIKIHPEHIGKVKELSLKVLTSDISRIFDLLPLKGTKGIEYPKFTLLGRLGLVDDERNIIVPLTRMATCEVIEDDTDLTGDFDKNMPCLTQNTVNTLIAHPEDIVCDGDYSYISLRNMDENEALFSSVIVSAGAVEVMDRINKFMQTGITTYHSFYDALDGFRKIVNTYTPRPINHLSLILRCFLISSEDDYRIPFVDDPNHVSFMKLSRIIALRSIGTEMAYERWNEHTANPQIFSAKREDARQDTHISTRDLKLPLEYGKLPALQRNERDWKNTTAVKI